VVFELFLNESELFEEEMSEDWAEHQPDE
jgi:hypothetical protein